MTYRSIIFLLAGAVLILLSLYLFTQPYYFKSFDFSASGQVGDTIGGISAPVINLIGAWLVYVSFQEQLQANRINFDALFNERERAEAESLYQKHVSQFNDIKNRVDNLEFNVYFESKYSGLDHMTNEAHIAYRGLNALNECTQRIIATHTGSTYYRLQQYETYSILLNYQYLLISIKELVESIDKKIKNESDKEFLYGNLKTFYLNLISSFGEKLTATLGNNNANIIQITELQLELNEMFKDSVL